MNNVPKIAVLDTNVLLLFLVGATDTSLLLTFKRVNAFNFDDLALLSRHLKPFKSLLTTPHVLTEVSNFVNQAPPHARERLANSLRAFVQRNEEFYETAQSIVLREEFLSLGLSDAGLVSLSSEAVIITADYQLWRQIIANGGHSINFNHLRTIAWSR